MRPHRRPARRGLLALTLALAVCAGLVGAVSSATGQPLTVAAAGTASSGESSMTLSHGAGSVTIKRDSYGTPQIYAKTTYGLFYGYGYAAAQDRLFQLDMTRRGAEGRVSEVLGSQYLALDEAVRANYDPASIRRQYDALPTSERDVLDGYAAGVNARVADVEAHPGTLLPKEYLDYGFQPTRWSPVDVAMITVGTMDIRFSDNSAELQNLANLQQLEAAYGPRKGMALFNQIAYKVDPLAPSTITPSDGITWPPTGHAASAASTATASTSTTASTRTPNGLVMGTSGVSAAAQVNRAASVQGISSDAVEHEFSNMMMIGRGKASGANGLLLNGPQFAFFNPSYVYAVGLHGAGFDLVGNTPFAYPVVLFGHNQQIAWGATAGNGDTVDYYQEVLNPANPHQYLYKGRYRTMGVRDETIDVKGGAPQHLQVYSTVHGLVAASDPADGVAYAKKRTWAGHELEVLFDWMNSTKAQSWSQWRTQAAALPISINWYFLDRAGDIGYFAAGHFPKRPASQDPRLPASGTGTMEWKGIQPSRTGNPSVLNPKDGWLANWNNSPITDFPNSDFIPWGAADRVTVIQRLLANRSSTTAQQLWKIMEQVAYTDVNAGNFVPMIKQAAQGLPADSKAAQAARVLTSWNEMNTDTNGDGIYDSPGTITMRTWIETMEQLVLGDDLPPSVFALYKTAGYPSTTPSALGSQNIQQGTKLVYNALLGKHAGVPQTVDLLNGKSARTVIREGLEGTYDTLAAQYGGGPSTWQAPVAPHWFLTTSYLGVPSASPDEQRQGPAFMNRGSENDLISAGSSGLTQWDVVAPGESGFVSPDGTASPHYSDQLQMYLDFGKHREWYAPGEVDRHAESQVTLHY